MIRTFGAAPSAEEIERLARAALGRLPAPFRAHLGDVVLRVEEFADEATLRALGIADRFALSGLYEGVPMGAKSIEASGTMPASSACSARRSSTNGSSAGTRRSSTWSGMCWCTR